MARRKLPVRRPLVQYDATELIQTHGNHTPRRVVIHDTESHDSAGTRDLQGVANYWHNSGLGLGAHLIIDKDGNTAYCAPEHKITWAVANRNTGTLHIELIGFARFTPQMWFARIAQLNKAAKWCAYWNLEYGIWLEKDPNYGISGHRDQPNQSHTDPGPFFPWTYFVRRAKQFRENGWS